MMIFANTDKEITLIYSSEDRIGKQILAYAQAESFPIHEVDLKHTKIPMDQWAEIAQRMGINMKGLINTDGSAYMQKFDKDADLSENDWLSLLEKNPDILRAPIAMKGDKVVFMENPQDMLQFIK